jgi:hypothetical protein
MLGNLALSVIGNFLPSITRIARIFKVVVVSQATHKFATHSKLVRVSLAAANAINLEVFGHPIKLVFQNPAEIFPIEVSIEPDHWRPANYVGNPVRDIACH